MSIGYCVPLNSRLASFRLRVAIPATHLGRDYVLGGTGQPTFFYKHVDGDVDIARACKADGIVYDVVNDHFDSKHGAHYRAMCEIADTITVASPAMAEVVRQHTGRDAEVIDDPWENEEQPATCEGNRVLWFGHETNLRSVEPYQSEVGTAGGELGLLTGRDWTRHVEDEALAASSLVFLTAATMTASANRVVKALRAGRFVVVPENSPPAWHELKDYIWIGSVEEGIRWALANRSEAMAKVQAGQEYIRGRFGPALIGGKWRQVFDALTSAPVTSDKRAGSESTSRLTA